MLGLVATFEVPAGQFARDPRVRVPSQGLDEWPAPILEPFALPSGLAGPRELREFLSAQEKAGLSRRSLVGGGLGGVDIHGVQFRLCSQFQWGSGTFDLRSNRVDHEFGLGLVACNERAVCCLRADLRTAGQAPPVQDSQPKLAVMNYRASEVICAQQMLSIAAGRHPLLYDDYSIEEVAHRYAVTRDAVYRGIRKGSPLYPKAVREGAGPKGMLLITRKALEACDKRRMKFYKTTPSWFKLNGLDAPGKKLPKRVAAKDLLGPV